MTEAGTIRAETAERSARSPGAEGLTIAGRAFGSRLILGSGRYDSPETLVRCIQASGAEIVTVALRRVSLDRADDEGLLRHLEATGAMILPNTAGCYTAEQAIRVARLARAAGLGEFVKLEVIGDERTLYPDVVELVAATRELVDEGFVVMPYTSDDVVVARRLEEAGAAAVMPLASPIGSGLGVVDPLSLRFILEAVSIPVIIDAGVGTASDAAIAMELGIDGILMNTAVAMAQDPVRMAGAMRLAVEAGRMAFEAGRMPRREWARASSPTRGRVGG